MIVRSYDAGQREVPGGLGLRQYICLVQSSPAKQRTFEARVKVLVEAGAELGSAEQRAYLSVLGETVTSSRPAPSVVALYPRVLPRGPCQCGSRQFWRSIYNVVICAVCHPPARKDLVQEHLSLPQPSVTKALVSGPSEAGADNSWIILQLRRN